MGAMRALALGVVFGCIASASKPVPGVVQWQIEKKVIVPPKQNELLYRRADTYEEVITNERFRGGYFTTCALGTPYQNVSLQLDTGSSDVWVPDVAAEACTASRQSPDGCDLGAFNPNRSSTYRDVGRGEFTIQYVDGSHSKGDYFTDRFEIGGAVLNNMTMGLGIDTDIAYGLAGVGYALNEAIVAGSQSASSAYPNLPVVMQQEGLINTVAYSLWLNDLDANTGSILFGGIDTAKYEGDLTRIDIYQDPRTRQYTSFIVALTSLQAVSTTGSDTLTSREFPVAVVLDSGTTLSYLPSDLAQQAWHEAGAVWEPQVQMAIIPCSRASSGGHFVFGFGGPDGPVIRVGMDELVLPLTQGQAPVFDSGPYSGQDACEFGIQNMTGGSGGLYLLGDTFLRSSYIVYDLINNQIGIAATDFNSTQTNVVAFPSLGATIPSATVAPNQNRATDQPTYTTPAYSAMKGFGDTATPTAAPSGGGGGGGNGGDGGDSGDGGDDDENTGIRAPPFDRSGLVVMGVTLLFVMMGSGILVL